MNVPRISWRQLVLKTRASGQLGHLFGSRTFGKAGVSISFSDPESDDDHHGAGQERNAPAPSMKASGQVELNTRKSHVGDDEADRRAELRERAVDGALLAGAFSVASSAAPLHSPPRAEAWAKRMTRAGPAPRRTSRARARSGRQPIRKVAMPMVSSEATRVPLRPNLSPKWPKRIDPSGRAMKATPKTANELSSATVVARHSGRTAPGRRARLRSRRRRSHKNSMDVPIRLATITRPREFTGAGRRFLVTGAGCGH